MATACCVVRRAHNKTHTRTAYESHIAQRDDVPTLTNVQRSHCGRVSGAVAITGLLALQMAAAAADEPAGTDDIVTGRRWAASATSIRRMLSTSGAQR
jgi:hypothetical protein